MLDWQVNLSEQSNDCLKILFEIDYLSRVAFWLAKKLLFAPRITAVSRQVYQVFLFQSMVLDKFSAIFIKSNRCFILNFFDFYKTHFRFWY